MWCVYSAWHQFYWAAQISLFQTATDRNMDMIPRQCWWCIIPIMSSFFLAFHGFKVFQGEITSARNFKNPCPRILDTRWISSSRVGFTSCFAPLQFQSSKHPQISSTWLILRMAVLGKDAPEVSISELLGSKSSQGLDHYEMMRWFVDFLFQKLQWRKGKKGVD